MSQSDKSVDQPTDTNTRGSHWSVTAWHEDIEIIEGWVNGGPRPTWLKEVRAQREECPTTGQLHLQTYLHTVQVRFGAIKAVLGKSRIATAKKPIALKQYVHKERTSVGPKLSMKVDDFVSVPDVLDMLGDILFAKKEEWLAQGLLSANEWFELAGSYLLEERYDLIGLLSQPQVQRAFTKWWLVLYKRAEARSESGSKMEV